MILKCSEEPVWCSACLDFIDELKLLGDPTLIGKTTNADSIYMEMRSIDLPSGLATLNFPIKQYLDRKRGHNEPYIPDVYVQEVDNIETILQTLKKQRFL